MKTKHTEGVMEVRFLEQLYIGDRRIADCAGDFEDEANAERLALAWNCHDELVEALNGLLYQWEDQFGEGVCDCRPEPENAGHVCTTCVARAILAKATKGE